MRFNYKERLGVLESGIVFTKQLKWIYRDQPLVDVGIDALIEESINGDPTGKFLAAQIKSGRGNIYETENSYTYYISNIHYEYWLNLDLPIILIVHIEELDKLFWELVSKENILRTNKKWKIELPKTKELCSDSKLELESIIQSNIKGEFVKQFLKGEITPEKSAEIIEGTKKLETSVVHLTNMAEIMTECGTGLTKFSIKINHYAKKGLNEKSREIKKQIADSSIFINSISTKLDEELELFTPKFIKGFSSFEKLSMILFELTQNYEEMENNYKIIEELPPNINFCITEIKNLRKSVSNLPMNFNALAKARTNYIDTCNRIISEFKVVNSMCFEFLDWLNKRIN